MTQTAPPAGASSDGAWLVRFANGDPEAARVLSARLGPRAYGFAYRLLQDAAEAEDVAQEALLRLWRHAPEWRQDGPAQPATWLLRVVRNLCIDRMRRAGGQALVGDGHEVLEQVPASGPSAEAVLLAADRAAALEAALASLPERQRTAVTLRHLEEMANPQIAAVMDISVEAVESLIARGKRALGAHLAGRKPELGFEDDTG